MKITRTVTASFRLSRRPRLYPPSISNAVIGACSPSAAQPPSDAARATRTAASSEPQSLANSDAADVISTGRRPASKRKRQQLSYGAVNVLATANTDLHDSFDDNDAKIPKLLHCFSGKHSDGTLKRLPGNGRGPPERLRNIANPIAQTRCRGSLPLARDR